MRKFSNRFGLAAIIMCGFGAALFAQDTRPTSRPAKSPFPALGAPAGVFGAGVTLDEGHALPAAVKKVDALKDKAVRIDGKIKDVCQKKGCWMVLGEGEQAMRVKFKDYKFFVPRDATGREVIIEGHVSVKTISEEVAKHYAEEGGNPEEAKKIKGPQKTLSFMATGVEILGGRELPPQAAGTPETAGALKGKLAAAKKIFAAKEKVHDAKGALGLLRTVKGPRSVEFSLCTEQDGLIVFSPAKAEPFSRGYAVKKGTGDVFQF